MIAAAETLSGSFLPIEGVGQEAYQKKYPVRGLTGVEGDGPDGAISFSVPVSLEALKGMHGNVHSLAIRLGRHRQDYYRPIELVVDQWSVTVVFGQPPCWKDVDDIVLSNLRDVFQ
jgi:hypothetical protein